MKVFTLPDLGEGLPDAVIREWYVKIGDEVNVDQPLAAMETAKALVDVPSPYTGTVAKFFGEIGDTINTNEPLVGFEGEAESTPAKESPIQNSEQSSPAQTVKASPAVRILARRLGVDLTNIKGSALDGSITSEDVENCVIDSTTKPVDDDMLPLPPVRRAMAVGMQKSLAEVVPVTICDDADIHQWAGKADVTIRLIRAISAACKAEPMLNAHFDGKQLRYKTFKHVNLGIAVDTPHGLYVPVLRDIDNLTDADIRQQINHFKEQAKNKTMAPDDQKGATIILSNFGSFIGRYATPIVTPPMTAIVGVGRSRLEIVPINETDTENHTMVPISVSVDHRAITGGEAARFLKAMVENLKAC